MSLDIKELDRKVNEHFDSVMPEQLHKDLVECGLGKYQGEEFNFLDDIIEEQKFAKCPQYNTDVCLAECDDECIYWNAVMSGE